MSIDAARRAAAHTTQVHWGCLTRLVAQARRPQHVAVVYAAPDHTATLINPVTGAMVILTADQEGVRITEEYQASRADWPEPGAHHEPGAAVAEALSLCLQREPAPGLYCVHGHTAATDMPGCDHRWVGVAIDGSVTEAAPPTQRCDGSQLALLNIM